MKVRTKLIGAGALLAIAAHGLAWAQNPADSSDPIGAILEQPQEAPADPNDPEAEPSTATTPEAAAPQAPAPAPYVPQTPAVMPPPVRYDAPPPVSHAPGPSQAAPYSSALPSAPPPAYAPYVTPPTPPRPTEPVNIDELGKTPDYPPNPTDLNYEARLRASSASAQGLQGPLDGPWTLRTSGGRELYALLLVDNAQGLDGAWRDPRRKGATDASGFLNAIQRSGGGVVITFYPAPGAGLSTVTLTPAADGSWTGELDERGDRQRVTLRRN